MNISNIIDYVIKVIIILLLVYFYVSKSLTLNRALIFLIVFFFIYSYSRVGFLINYIFNNKKVKIYIQDHKEIFRKILYVLLEIHRGINPLIVFLTYTDKGLYKINRYVTGTRFIRYNFIIYVVIKYYVMFGFVKLLIYKYYNLGYKFDQLTIAEILFKRMYGLILSILIFTDLLNNIINILSQYNIGIYVLVYYVLSTLCIVLELACFYSFKNGILKLLYLRFVNILKYINIFEIYKYLVVFLYSFIGILDVFFQKFTKMDVIIFLKSQYTGLGQTIICILEIIVLKESNFKERFLSIEFVRETSFFTSGRIAYYIPLENRIPLKYFDYIGGLINLKNFDPTFQLYGENFKGNLSYFSFFKSRREIKNKPSIYIYMQLQELARLYDVHNQPINRLMNGKYFSLKYEESLKLLNKDESLVVNRNLKYFNEVDDLRAKLMFFIIGDIEYFYNNNSKDYCGNYWIIQYHSILDQLIFQMDAGLELLIAPSKQILKFYDPEENMVFLNRLFNVLGILYIEDDVIGDDEVPYYVSKKFTNYNEKYAELLRVMYTYDFKRWEENQCACSYLSVYEIEIAYKTEEYFNNLRAEGETLLGENLEERNWRLLKSLEDLM